MVMLQCSCEYNACHSCYAIVNSGMRAGDRELVSFPTCQMFSWQDTTGNMSDRRLPRSCGDSCRPPAGFKWSIAYLGKHGTQPVELCTELCLFLPGRIGHQHLWRHSTARLWHLQAKDRRRDAGRLVQLAAVDGVQDGACVLEADAAAHAVLPANPACGRGTAVRQCECEFRHTQMTDTCSRCLCLPTDKRWCANSQWCVAQQTAVCSDCVPSPSSHQC